MASTKTQNNKLRNSFSFPNILLSFLNLILFLLSLTSLIPILLLKTPPTSLGYALLLSSFISIFSSFLGLFSRIAHHCFTTHIAFLLASLSTQILSFLALFTRENSTLLMLGSSRDPKEAKLLVRVECGILVLMVLLQFGVLVLSCGVHWCWLREFRGLEEDRERMEMKRSEKDVVVVDVKELDEKVKGGNGKYSGNLWVKNDFEG